MSEEMTLQDIVRQCLEDSYVWFDNTNQSTEFMTLALAGEVGELANMVKKVWRGSHSDEGSTAWGIDEEIVDIFIYLCNLAGIRGIDLAKAYQEKRAKNVQRFSPANRERDVDWLSPRQAMDAR